MVPSHAEHFLQFLARGCVQRMAVRRFTTRLRSKSTTSRYIGGRAMRRMLPLCAETFPRFHMPWKHRCSGRHAVKRLYCKVCSKSTPSRCAYGQAIRRNGFLARGDFSTIHASWRACGSFGGWHLRRLTRIDAACPLGRDASEGAWRRCLPLRARALRGEARPDFGDAKRDGI